MRFKGIDGLRAFAVVSVIASHAHVFWLHGGGVGVDIFFGISGFLITYLLINEQKSRGRIDIGKFWLRRLLRLMPALLVVVVCVDVLAIAVSYVRPNDYLQDSLAATPSVLLYFSNWMIVGTDSSYLGWFGPLWSLSVEEQFYLVWPLVVILVMRTRRPLTILASVASVVAVAAAVNRFFVLDGANLYRTFGTDVRVDMLLAGGLLAIAMRAGFAQRVEAVSRILAAPAAVYLVFVAIMVPEFGAPGVEDEARLYYTVGLPFVALSTVAIVGFIVTHQGGITARALSARPLAYTGRISYGMYLWHYPVIMAIKAVTTDLDETVTFAIALAGTYVAAALSWRLIEKPLSDRFHVRLKPAPAPEPTLRMEAVRPVPPKSVA